MSRKYVRSNPDSIKLEKKVSTLIEEIEKIKLKGTEYPGLIDLILYLKNGVNRYKNFSRK